MSPTQRMFIFVFIFGKIQFPSPEPGLPWQSRGGDTVRPLRWGAGLIPGQGTRIPHATQCGPKTENKKIPLSLP